MSKWSKQQDAQLIRLVAQQRVLYDAAAPDHRNLLAKHHAWNDISVALGMPIPAIKKRWKHFRDHYRKKERQSKANIKDNWEYKPLLGFLKVNTDNQESEAQTSNVEDVTDAEDINNSKESNSNQGTENRLISNKRKDNDETDDKMRSEIDNEEKKEREGKIPFIRKFSAIMKSKRQEKAKELSVLNFENMKKSNSEEIDRNGTSTNSFLFKNKVNDALEVPLNNHLNYNANNNDNNQITHVPNLPANTDSFIRNYEAMLDKITLRLENQKNLELVGKRESTEVHETRKKQKTTGESNSEEEMTDSGVKREEIFETLSGMKTKFQSMVLDIERCVDKTGSYAKVRKRTHVSPVHRYFEVVADVVAMLPPHLVAKTRLKICETINQIEELYLQNYQLNDNIRIVRSPHKPMPETDNVMPL